MKLQINADFTKMVRAVSVVAPPSPVAPADRIALAHDERHLRRKVLRLGDGAGILVDLEKPVHLAAGDRLKLEDGREIEIAAEPEEVMEIVARDRLHLAQICWHIGNRHLAAQIEENRILILRDHVIKAMLEGLGASVRDVVEPFSPVHGAYSGHGHTHDHDHSHDHGHHHHG